ncbi:MAG: pyridoxal phosphate-dependent aminotransferase [Oscillospiraceae bacterium]|nr:pyridoxal phosphate-dependent aminotransferase [Oscillospiraceae bacterium]
MLPERILGYGKNANPIREISEYGKKRAAEIGRENLFDFSIGNPSVPCPEKVTETLLDLVKNTPAQKLHAYTSAVGDPGVRQAVADFLNSRYGQHCCADGIYLTAGSAAALAICLTALVNPGEEVVMPAPFFTEYPVYVEQAGGVSVIVPCGADFQPDIAAIERAITEKTRVLLINSPNNPSGVVFTKESICALCELLRRKSEEYGEVIYLLSDEPYRELAYDGVEVPYLPNYYDHTLVCNSFSKTLSLAGERVGFILVPEKVKEWRDVYAAVGGAGRALGYINLGSMFQFLLPACLGETADLSVYAKNREILVNALREYGYEMASPDGAFYLFVKAPDGDDMAFCQKAREFELLFVPGTVFYYPGYVRVAYCLDTDTILRALPAFKALAESYKK